MNVHLAKYFVHVLNHFTLYLKVLGGQAVPLKTDGK